jgi:hypothetical protein
LYLVPRSLTNLSEVAGTHQRVLGAFSVTLPYHTIALGAVGKDYGVKLPFLSLFLFLYIGGEAVPSR